MTIAIRKLSQDEVAQFFPRGVSAPQTEYIEALRGLHPGDAAEAVRDGITGRAMKRRLTLAAKHLGLSLHYAKDSTEDVIRFQVREPRGTRAVSAAPAASEPKRRGRPPKNPR